MEVYKKWVRDNKDFMHYLGSLASATTWLLPEQLFGSEIGSEAVSAMLGLIISLNDHIIDTAPTQIKAGFNEPWSFPYPFCITMLTNFETLIEVTAEHRYGEEKKWNVIACTEATKVLVRLWVFYKSGYKMLLEGGEMPNEENHFDASSSQSADFSMKPEVSYHSVSLVTNGGPYKRNVEGKALSALSKFGETARMVQDRQWLLKVHPQDAMGEAPVIVRPSLSTVSSENGHYGAFFMAGEVIFITRPLIYVLLIRKCGIRSWIPWFLSLVVDFTGMGILSYVTSARNQLKKPRFDLSAEEKAEVRRRKMLWAFYMMRDPFFSKYTRQRLEQTEKALEPLPVIGFLTAKIVELIIGVQTRYTYMSGS